ncbi:MAG: lipocalin family protein [Chitinophagaceae bacterium]|nr:lipocalin family protein [Chitinophagaceae bacterium]
MKKILSFIVLAVLFTACKKDKDNCSLSTEAIQGSYKITAMKYKASASSPELDVLTTYLDECDRDNVLTLSAGGVYTIADAGVVCTPSSADNGTWSLSGTTMTVDGIPGTVGNFSCSAFTVSSSDNLVAGDVLIITYTRQ